MSTFEFPPLTPNGVMPIWQQQQFIVGTETTRILDYLSGQDEFGWTDGLTAFHEEEAGENHPIDQASRQHALQQLRKNLKNTEPTILEIGCSSGFMLQSIRNQFPQALVLGADIVKQPLQTLATTMPDLPLLRFDLTQCPLADSSLDAIVLLNVLEHIEADDKALEQVHRILKPDGVAIIEVPAGPHLYDIYDKMLLHYRRYTNKSLSELVLNNGLTIKYNSHLGFFVYPAFWLVKKRNRRLFTDASVDAAKERVANNIRKTRHNLFMEKLMKLELTLGKMLSYPLGIRCLMTCIKK